MDPIDRRRFWINWFLGGFGIAVGGIGIGVMVGGSWMYLWPVNINIILAAGGLLVTISTVMLAKSGKYFTEMDRRRNRKAEDSGDQDSPSSARTPNGVHSD